MPTYASRSLWTEAAAPPAFDSATLAWVAAVIANGGTVSSTREQLVDDLIVGLKDDGVWTKLDRLWLFAAENQDAAQVDLVANAIVTENSSPTFTADEGYTGDGSTSYLDTNFTPGTGSPHWISGSAHYSQWNLTNSTSNQIYSGQTNAGSSWQAFGGAMYTRVNDADGPTTGFTNPVGHILASRTNMSDRTTYRNASAFATDTSADADITTQNFFILWAGNSGGTKSATQVAEYSIGGGLTGTDVANFYSRLRTYMTAVGVP